MDCWRCTTSLLKNQSRFSPALLSGVAEELGLNPSDSGRSAKGLHTAHVRSDFMNGPAAGQPDAHVSHQWAAAGWTMGLRDLVERLTRPWRQLRVARFWPCFFVPPPQEVDDLALGPRSIVAVGAARKAHDLCGALEIAIFEFAQESWRAILG